MGCDFGMVVVAVAAAKLARLLLGRRAKPQAETSHLPLHVLGPSRLSWLRMQVQMQMLILSRYGQDRTPDSFHHSHHTE